ncbi:MAG: hypothetical protein C4542_00615 [Dehalococcoidia bacterium]|nr:MAG: hypothetical protein C4542_00615 [Dehalococcoidia bacterium]
MNQKQTLNVGQKPWQPKNVAIFMLQELNRVNYLYQETVVWQIKEKFDDRYVYDNQNGNLAISKDVLREFRLLTGDNVVWERGSRLWRKRASYDMPGKRLAD